MSVNTLSSLPHINFIDNLLHAFEEGELIKCTLSKPKGNSDDLPQKVFIRSVKLKKGLRLAFNHRYKTKDEVKNYTKEEARPILETFLGQQFNNAVLLSTGADYQYKAEPNGKAQVFKSPPSQKETPDVSHDRNKDRLLDPTRPWLHALGITNKKGQVLANAQDKWRQINKYLEIIDALLRTFPLPDKPRIADMGSGKGYLSFALYDYLTSHKGLQPSLTGIELRTNLVDKCNAVASENQFDGLRFEARDIREFARIKLDMLIALHACDTATDLALAAGISSESSIIIAAPCCHKQVRKEMEAKSELASVLKHGILEERQAEIITDGIRALLLESKGYNTKVFEFISTEHTAKNLMITAIKKSRPKPGAIDQVDAIKKQFGIETHFMETLI